MKSLYRDAALVLTAYVVLLLAVFGIKADAQTEDDIYLMGDALQAEIAKNCQKGCITLNREEAAQVKASMSANITKAYNLGLKACRKEL